MSSLCCSEKGILYSTDQLVRERQCFERNNSSTKQTIRIVMLVLLIADLIYAGYAFSLLSLVTYLTNWCLIAMTLQIGLSILLHAVGD